MKKTKETLLLILPLLLFVFLKLHFWENEPYGDERIVIKTICSQERVISYFGHFPLGFYLYQIPKKVFGCKIFYLKLWVFLISLFSIVLIYLLFKRLKYENEVILSSLLLFSIFPVFFLNSTLLYLDIFLMFYMLLFLISLTRKNWVLMLSFGFLLSLIKVYGCFVWLFLLVFSFLKGNKKVAIFSVFFLLFEVLYFYHLAEGGFLPHDWVWNVSLGKIKENIFQFFKYYSYDSLVLFPLNLFIFFVFVFQIFNKNKVLREVYTFLVMFVLGLFLILPTANIRYFIPFMPFFLVSFLSTIKKHFGIKILLSVVVLLACSYLYLNFFGNNWFSLGLLETQYSIYKSNIQNYKMLRDYISKTNTSRIAISYPYCEWLKEDGLKVLCFSSYSNPEKIIFVSPTPDYYHILGFLRNKTFATEKIIYFKDRNTFSILLHIT